MLQVAGEDEDEDDDDVEAREDFVAPDNEDEDRGIEGWKRGSSADSQDSASKRNRNRNRAGTSNIITSSYQIANKDDGDQDLIPALRTPALGDRLSLSGFSVGSFGIHGTSGDQSVLGALMRAQSSSPADKADKASSESESDAD